MQMTVEKLYLELKELVDQGMGDKKIIVADDIVGSGFHGIYYSCTSDANSVRDNIDFSNGLTDSQETDPRNLIIIG